MYTIRATLFDDGGTVLYRATRDQDTRPVILKRLGPKRPLQLYAARLEHEFEIGRALDGPFIVKPLAFEVVDGAPTLVLEDFVGVSLASQLGAPMSPERFLPLAMDIARAVAALHAHGVIHKDLKPQNILIHPTTFEVKLVDLGIASRLVREQRPPESPSRIEGSLAYMAPEQTGRMNRLVDSRADLYSLGVVFFQMLTGRLPFEAIDPVEWVHCHIARVPPGPSELVRSVPRQLSAIVLKLLSKLPEERYRSASGLLKDLERSARSRTVQGDIEPFPLGEHDVSERFQVPQTLYGREVELAALHEAYQAVAATGTPSVVLVSGYSGIGKSSLVSELHKPVVSARGSFLSGKFDQLKRDIPYATVAQAFQEHVRELLSEPEERLASWRERLGSALGANARLMVDLVPELETLLGPQPSVVELSLTEAKTRFHSVFRSFLAVFAQRARPVLLFLDDLQWVDTASLELLAEVMTHADTQNVLLVGAYRSNEVGLAHPLVRFIERVKKGGLPLRELQLAPLSPGDVARLVGAAVLRPVVEVEALSQLVFEKTGGNPFFAIQFLTSLCSEGLLELDALRGTWVWDIERIRSKGYTDNVIDLMVGKLNRFSPEARAVLQLAACVGHASDARVLATVAQLSEEQVHERLWPALQEGLMSRVGAVYVFAHDRIQQAAYSLVPEGQRPALHLRIGRLLRERMSPARIEQEAFGLVSHFNLGASLLSSAEDRRDLARLNLVAGKKAKAAAAYGEAARYFGLGFGLLGPEAWGEDRAQAFSLRLEQAQCTYLDGRFDEALALLAELKGRALDKVERADIFRVEVDACLVRGDIARAVEAALEGLAGLGIVMSAHPPLEEVSRLTFEVLAEMGNGPIEGLLDLAPMTDPEMMAAMRLLAALYAPAYFTDNNLLYLHAVHMVRLSLKYGNAEASTSGYSWFGFVLAVAFHRYPEGYRFARLGHALMEKQRIVSYRASANMLMEMLSYWNRPIDEMVGYIHVAFQAAVEAGDRPIAGYASNHLVIDLLERGDPLPEVYRESAARLEFISKTGYQDIADIIVTQQRFIQNLRGLTTDFSTFSDERFDEKAFEAQVLAPGRMSTMVCWYHLMKCMARVFSGDFAEAAQSGAKARELLWASRGLLQFHQLHAFHPLALAATYESAGPEERKAALAQIKESQALLAEWAANCPHNFQATSALVSAELARITGEPSVALALYEQAYRSARDHGFVQYQALAAELASRFHRAEGRELIADAYLREARDCYERWGASGKVAQLERAHTQVLKDGRSAAMTTLSLRSEQLDLLAVLKASQSIAQEMLPERLRKALLKVAIEQSGAQRGVLLLTQQNRLTVEAEAKVGQVGLEIRLHDSRVLTPADFVPWTMVQGVQRSRERVVVDDAVKANPFASDEYFQWARPRSVGCFPILLQGSPAGLLYLENELVPGAFTPERLVALELIASQAAVSFENASLLARERTARQRAEEAERHAAFLAQASAFLVESLKVDETLQRLAEWCIRDFADWFLVELVVEKGTTDWIAWARRDEPPAGHPGSETALKARWPTSPFAARVMASRERLRLGEGRGLGDERSTQFLADLKGLAAVSVPLVARGQVLGALTVGPSASAPIGGDGALELFGELGRRIAVAVENARLYEQAQAAVRLRDEFLSVASHELYTPMTSLVLSLQALERSAAKGDAIPAESAQRLVGLALRQGGRLNRLISDLLDVARIDAGQLPLTRAGVDLSEVVREVLTRFEPELQAASCAVSVQLEPVVGDWDGSRVDQVVTNLLANARKFGAGKPIEVRVERVVRDEGGPERARLSVIDHGFGVPLERQSKIFERFERAVSVHSYGGLGLGLYISRRIVEAHGGTVRVESRPGEPTCFVVELPLAASGVSTA